MIVKLIVAALLAISPACIRAPGIPAPEDSRNSMLREAMLGLLKAQPTIEAKAGGATCLRLPVAPPNDRINGPRGDSLVTTRCQVVEYRPLESAAPSRWFEVLGAQRVRAVWHARFETGVFAILRSVTPTVAARADGSVLLRVMSCVNGTGGCSDEFLHRHRDGVWAPVWQVWFDQLPESYAGRIRHGVDIDPATLRGVAGFYGGTDPNCCPSEILQVTLALHGDSLVLLRHKVAPQP